MIMSRPIGEIGGEVYNCIGTVWAPRKFVCYLTELEGMQVSNALQRLRRLGLVESKRTKNNPKTQVWRRKLEVCPECGREY